MLNYLKKEDLQFQILINIALITGCRCGELVGLKFSDVDFNSNKITIQRSVYKIPNKPASDKETKDYEIRTISVDDDCIELIKTLKTKRIEIYYNLGIEWNENN